MIWITKEGEEIDIKDMSSDHLTRCINMLQSLNVKIKEELSYIYMYEDSHMEFQSHEENLDQMIFRNNKTIAKMRWELKSRGLRK